MNFGRKLGDCKVVFDIALLRLDSGGLDYDRSLSDHRPGSLYTEEGALTKKGGRKPKFLHHI